MLQIMGLFISLLVDIFLVRFSDYTLEEIRTLDIVVMFAIGLGFFMYVIWTFKIKQMFCL